VFENRVPRNIFEPKCYEVTGEWGKPRNGQVNDFYSSLNILVIKPRRLRWAWHVPRMGRGEMYIGFCWVSLKERNHLKDLFAHDRILKWILK
jgi:hypothetical protein